MSAQQEDTLGAVARGEDDAFARVVGPHRAELRCFALRIVGGDAGLAEEVLQEALLRAARNRSHPRGSAAKRGALCASA